MDLSADRKKSSQHRKRFKGLNKEIIDQMEFYFSDANLQKDRYIKRLISASPDGYIDLEKFSNFNKLKAITKDMNIVAKALRFSELIEVSGDGKRIKRSKPLADPKDVDDRTVYVEYLPRDIDHEWVKNVFSVCGKVVYVSLPKYPTTGDLKGFGFVEFQTKEEADKACDLLNNPPVSAGDKVGHFPVGNKAFLHLSKQVQQQTPAEDEQEEQGMDQDQSKQDQKNQKGKKRKRQSSANVDKDEIKISKSDTEITPEQTQDKSSVTDSNKPEDHSETTEENTNCSRKRSLTNSEQEGEGEGVSAKRPRDDSPENTSRKRPLDDSTDGEEEVKVKRTKTDDEENEGEKEDTKKGKKKNKKRQNKKKKDKEKETVLPELRVIPKKKWSELKKEYLKLQKKSMQALKKSLLQQKHEAVKETKQEPTAAGDKNTGDKPTESKGSKGIEFIPDVIVKVETKMEVTRTTVKELVSAFTEVTYIDYTDGSCCGHIRCRSAESAQKLANTTIHGYTFTLLSGDDEKQYWNKIISDREEKLKGKKNTKKNPKKRGTQKIMEKADKLAAPGQAAKHVFFDD